MPGVFLRHGDDLVAMTEAPYEAEAVLQELLARYPALLAGDTEAGPEAAWLLIRREAGIALGQEGGPRGSLDHVFVDAQGMPTLVEVKRAADSRVRREVVGQMLDYAANAASRRIALPRRRERERRPCLTVPQPRQAAPGIASFERGWAKRS